MSTRDWVSVWIPAMSDAKRARREGGLDALLAEFLPRAVEMAGRQGAAVDPDSPDTRVTIQWLAYLPQADGSCNLIEVPPEDADVLNFDFRFRFVA